MKKFSKNFDWGLFIVSIILLCIGLLAIYSSTKSKSSSNDFYKQMFFVGPALFACFTATFFDYYKLRQFSKPIYIINLLALLSVLVLGHKAYGAQRWIVIAGFTIQPSEIAKIAIIITMADLLSKKCPQTMKELIPVFIHFLIPTALIFKQPDLGTALSILGIVFGMIYGAGVNLGLLFVLVSPAISIVLFLINKSIWVLYLAFLLSGMILFIKKDENIKRVILKISHIKYLIVYVINIISGLFVPFVWNYMLKGYQKKRIMVFLNPDADPLGAGYHINQSKVAIGSGGIFGKGLFEGTQTQLNFVPFQHTDFIFSVISEEFGFIGCMYILFLFLILIWRGLYIASKASTEFGRLIAIGTVSMFIFHIFVNIGMVLGILPAKGLPLPLMSYGGTFLVITMTSIGILESISIRKEKRLMFKN